MATTAVCSSVTLLPKTLVNDSLVHTGAEIGIGGFKEGIFSLVATGLSGTLTVTVKLQGYDTTSGEWNDYIIFADITDEETQVITKVGGIGRRIRISYQRIAGTGTINISCGVVLKI